MSVATAVRKSIVLALNSGSSSLKFGLYRVGSASVDTLLSGAAEGIGSATGRFHVQDADGDLVLSETTSIPGPTEALEHIGRRLSASAVPVPTVIGHRIVHGGPGLRQHCPIDATVVRQLEAATPFAPLHMPAALSVICFAQTHFPGVPQVACFDTAFHAELPDVARTLPVPRALRAQGIQRYGFHGLSCESIVHQLANDPPGRLIVAHLGNGASVTAVRDGRSIDTSMGLTPSGGVVMSTRSGDLDPGVLVYLMREQGFDAGKVADLVDHRSGLLGISGVSGDLRDLHEVAASNADAQLAIAMFCHAVRKQVAAMIAVLDGVDVIVFTGGIGENDALVRAAICEGLQWIGVGLDAARNRVARNPVNDAASRCSVLVLPSREDEQIARHAWALSG